MYCKSSFHSALVLIHLYTTRFLLSFTLSQGISRKGPRNPQRGGQWLLLTRDSGVGSVKLLCNPIQGLIHGYHWLRGMVPNPKPSTVKPKPNIPRTYTLSMGYYHPWTSQKRIRMWEGFFEHVLRVASCLWGMEVEG